ncbi:MAG: hypothetical protein M3Y33_05765 [Actinomycetota bacterium]|nr:hypothetical protein [Actinomycetota bacterium]
MTVLPLTTWVVVVVATPEPLVVTTECDADGGVAPDAALPAADAVPVAGNVVLAAGAVVGKAWWARATVATPVPTISAAAVQFDARRTCRMPSRRAAAGLSA